MKKVAIMTLYGEDNYGNRLQNYAVQKTFENMNCKAETIVIQEIPTQKRRLKSYVARFVRILCPCFILKSKLDYIRLKKFKKYTKKYINTRFFCDNEETLRVFEEEYDYFAVGSDQVWNPNFGNYTKAYDKMFLTFVPRSKRICFSPSIGVSKIDDVWIDKFKKGFDGFNQLSIREQSGAELIKEICGKEAMVLIDPTLMLDKDEWLRVSKKSKAPKKPYVLEYFLGERDNEKLNDIAKDNALSRVTLLDRNSPNIYISDPGEFIDLVANSDMVCTDSFHACVFSIIFGKPFIVCKRNDATQDMYSRIDTLLDLFEADDNGTIIKISEEKRSCILEKERKKVFDFLIKCMN